MYFWNFWNELCEGSQPLSLLWCSLAVRLEHSYLILMGVCRMLKGNCWRIVSKPYISQSRVKLYGFISKHNQCKCSVENSWNINRRVSKTDQTSKQPKIPWGRKKNKGEERMDLKVPKNLVVGQWNTSVLWIFMKTELLTPNVGSMGGWDAKILLMLLCGQSSCLKKFGSNKNYFSSWP